MKNKILILQIVESFFLKDGRTIFIFNISDKSENEKLLFDNYKGMVDLYLGNHALDSFLVYTEISFPDSPTSDWRAFGTMYSLEQHEDIIKSHITAKQCCLKLEIKDDLFE